MKKITSIFCRIGAALLLCVTLAACSTPAEPKTTSEPKASSAAAGTNAAQEQKTAAATGEQGTETPEPEDPNAPPLTLTDKRAKTQIGIWYSIWYDLRTQNSFWENSGSSPALPIYYRPLLPNGTYGTYDSGDDAIIQYHFKEITDAQIDFIIMDQTNMIDAAPGNLNANSIKVAKAIRQWNDAGKRQLRYCSAIGAFAAVNKDLTIIESEAKKLYERYVNKPWGTEDYHVYVDGKPLMIIFETTKEQWDAYKGDKTYTNKFTLRFATGHAYNPGFWGWVMPKGALVTKDVACVMPGWYKFNHAAEKVYRQQGSFYRKCWETVLASDVVPNYLVINSFNEYAEHTAVFTAKTDKFPSDYPIERWIDESGTENPSMYWDMTKEYIVKYKNGDLK